MKTRTLACAVTLLACIALAMTLNDYYVFVLASIALTAIVGIGLNVLFGLTGQVSFGHVGFYAIGAYTVAILTTKAGWSFWPAWAAGTAVAGLVGALLALPALRVKGPYLAMVTIAFSFIVEHAIVEMPGLTGGQSGIMGIGSPTFGGLASPTQGLAIIALLVVCALSAAYARLSRSAWGAAMRAVRDSETAAESIGISPLAVKTAAFAISAALAGIAGGLFAPLSGFVTPETFTFMQSILFLLVVVIGGAGSLAGPLIGALIIGVLPEWLASLESYRLLFFGALLLVVLWLAPEGIAGVLQRLRRKASGQAHVASGAAQAGVLASRARQALQVRGLGMTFGGLRAVSGLDFDVPPAAVLSLIGPNGAGKTTVLNMLSGFYTPSAGTFALGGKPLQDQSAFRIARHGIARTYQTSLLFDSLSVEENVVLASLRGRLGFALNSAAFASTELRQRARSLLAFCGYAGSPDAPAAGLPHVDRRLVEIARALAGDPDVLLLDEPAAGLNREDKERLAQLLRQVAQAGIGVAVVEHDMALVMEISDRIVVLDAGRRLAVGSAAQIQADPAVRLAYLGESLAPAAGARRASKADAPELLGVGGLVAGYGADPVLQGIDLQVRQGEMVALLGANGAGKSTLMRTLAGLHRPTAGGIHLGGRPLQDLSAQEIVALGVVLVPEGRQVFPDLSVLDNIRLGAFLHWKDVDADVERMLVQFPRLRERLHQRAGLLSGGEQQMLAMARALMSRPRILLLDEPSLGLAPKIIADLFNTLDRLRQDDMTLLLVDQMAGLALALADRAYVMDTGRVVAQGAAADIEKDDALARAYLGAH
jgi:ABC-type branched-subunit amino acid transport system ATPase component/ABC-type branched-subunit amino acid transport system permease subunit